MIILSDFKEREELTKCKYSDHIQRAKETTMDKDWELRVCSKITYTLGTATTTGVLIRNRHGCH